MVKVKRSDAHGNCGGKEMCRKFQWGNFRVKDHSLDKDVDVWITLKWIVRNEKKTRYGFKPTRCTKFL